MFGSIWAISLVLILVLLISPPTASTSPSLENANLNPFETAWYQDATPVFNVHGTNCTCAPDPVLLNPSCILCICGSQKPFSYGGATFKRTCGITKGCPTKLNYVNGYSSSCACAPDPLLRGNKWVMCSCPRLPTAKFPPIPSTYTSWPAMNKTSPKFSDWPVCNAPYALCSFANCTLDFKGKEKSPILMAECGCVLPFSQNKLPPRFSLVDPAYILDRRLFRQYKRECPEGKKTSVRCAAPNGTSICRQIAKNTIYGGKYDYVSTYSVSKESGGFNEACNAVDPVDQMYAQCMTAACYKKKAFDGSPISCYCPVYRDRSYLIGAPKGAGKPTCKVTLPYVLSGVTNFLPGSLGGARV